MSHRILVYRNDESKEYNWEGFSKLAHLISEEEDPLMQTMDAMDIMNDLLEGKDLNKKGYTWKAKKL